MRTRSVVATLAAIVFVSIGTLAVWSWRQIKSVEASARECEPLIETLARLRADLGAYPPPDSASLPAKLAADCHYQLSTDGYVLTAGDFGLQWYEYDSAADEWRWD
jgi:hypothetical protein